MHPHGRHPWIKESIEAVYGPVNDMSYFERKAQVKKVRQMEYRMLFDQSREIQSAEGLDIDVKTYRSNSIGKSSINSYKAIESQRNKSQKSNRKDGNRSPKEANGGGLLGRSSSMSS